MTDSQLPAPLPAEPIAAPLPRRERAPLLPERSDFLEGDEPAAAKVEAFLAKALLDQGSLGSATSSRPWTVR